MQRVYTKLCSFVDTLVDHIVQEERVTMAIKERVYQHLSEYMERAMTELKTLVQDERQQPITYNHYFTDNIQKDRQSEARELISQLMEQTAADDWHGAMHISNNGVDVKRLINALQKRVVVDMDEQACKEARAGLDAYYKVSYVRCKTFKEAYQHYPRLQGRLSSTTFASRSLSGIFFARSRISFRQRLLQDIKNLN